LELLEKTVDFSVWHFKKVGPCELRAAPDVEEKRRAIKRAVFFWQGRFRGGPGGRLGPPPGGLPLTPRREVFFRAGTLTIPGARGPQPNA